MIPIISSSSEPAFTQSLVELLGQIAQHCIPIRVWQKEGEKGPGELRWGRGTLVGHGCVGSSVEPMPFHMSSSVAFAARSASMPLASIL